MKLKRILVRTLVVALTSSLLICSLAAAEFSGHFANTKTFDSAALLRSTRIQHNTPRRRPRSYDVLHYIIRTTFDVPNRTVIGEVDVTFKPLSSGFNTLDLDAASMKIEQVSLSDGTPLKSFMRSNTLRIMLNRGYATSETITVRVKYRTTPQRGLYFVSSSSVYGFQRPQHIWTQGEPEDNHFWFPCYDFPDDKATSEQFITTGEGEIAIANGTLVETIDNPNGTRTFHWRMSQVHSSYLISLIVGDYAKLTDTYENVSVEYHTYRGTEQQALRAFDKTPLMMRWFGSALGYKFPYDRYAQTVVGDFIFGGMENITATTFLDTEILGRGDGSMGSDTVNLVSHELAHSWFGDLVTCKDWANLWLNEGFATFLEAAFRESQEGRDAYLFELQKDAVEYFLEDPSSQHHPLVNPNYPLTMELFDSTTYKKGAFVLHMLRETVGDGVFWKALNVYLNEYKYRTVDSRDLEKVFERVSGQSLRWFFDQWVYKAGYPELRVHSKYDPAKRLLTLNVTQTQKADNISPAVFRFLMDIEIVTTSGPRIERVEVNQRTQDFTFELDSRPVSVTLDKRASVLKKLSILPSRGGTTIAILDGANTDRQIRATRSFDLLSVMPSYLSPFPIPLRHN